MSRYSQLSLAERCSIARLHEDGQSIRQIAAALDRQPSTIARELKRNPGAKVGYQPAYAQARAEARRWTGARLDRDHALREAILHRPTGRAMCRASLCTHVYISGATLTNKK